MSVPRAADAEDRMLQTVRSDPAIRLMAPAQAISSFEASRKRCMANDGAEV